MLPQYLVLPGGFPLDDGRDGDVGYDIQIRAIVSTERDPNIPYMLQTIWDLQSEPPESLRQNVCRKDNRWIYLLHPNGIIHLGVGLVLGGDSFDWCAHTRSGKALEQLSVKNYMDDVIWDPNFRGEGLVFLKNESSIPVEVFHGWKPASFVFRPKYSPEGCWARPEFLRVYNYDELGKTERMTQWKSSSDKPRPVQTELGLIPGQNGYAARPLPSQIKRNPHFWNTTGMPT